MLVWTECPYVQFVAAACVTSTEFIVGGLQTIKRGRSSQVSVVRLLDASTARSIDRSISLERCPAFRFYRPSGKNMIPETERREEGKKKEK